MTTTITPPTDHSAPNSEPPATRAWDTTLSLSQIEPSPFNPRRHFDEEALAELAASIRQHGLLQPIVVRPLDFPTRLNTYTIVAGERRWRAAALAGLTEIPVRVLPELTDGEHIRLALIENLQRRDLDPIEEAEGYARLTREVGMRQGELATAVNRSQPAIANALRLLDLPEDVRERIRTGELSVSHGVALASYKQWPALASALAEYAVEHRWTVKEIPDRLGDYTLQQRGLVVALNGAAFDYQATCGECPFGAHRAGQYQRYCLQPEHYRELQAAATVAIEERVAAAKAGSDGRLLEADLDRAAYEGIWGTPPAGCSETCACRAIKVNDRGDERPICTDPKRYRALTKAENEAREAERERRQATALAELRALLDETAIDVGDDSATRRLLVVIVAAALDHLNSYDGAELALGARHGDLLPRQPRQDGVYSSRHLPSRIAELDAAPTETLIRWAVEILLGVEVQRRAGGQTYAGTALADWYLGTGAMPSPVAMDAEEAATGERTCRECGCTDADGCPEGRSWVEADLCSQCLGLDDEDWGDDPPARARR